MMEIVEVGAAAIASGDRQIVVRHSQTQLERGLDPRESVVLHADGGDYYAAQVRGIAFEVDDTIYTFDVGARLPEDLAVQRVDGLDPVRHDVSMHELVDLLGELRDHAS